MNVKIGFPGLLFLLLLTLKLTHYIDWSWWWVTAPMWGPTGIYLACASITLVVAGVIFLGATAMEAVNRRRLRKKRGF